MSVKFIFS